VHPILRRVSECGHVTGRERSHEQRRPPDVEDRIREFWRDHPAGRIVTQLLHHHEGDYIVQYAVRHCRWHGGRFMGFDAAPGDYIRGFAAMYQFESGQIAERCETT